MVLPSGPLERITAGSAYIYLVFQASNIPDAAGVANTVEPATPEYVMDVSGSIVGLAVRSNAVFSTGTVTFRPRINGTASTTKLQTVLDSSNQQRTTTEPAGGLPFSAGQRLSVDWTKSGTVAPLTNDVSILMRILITVPDK